MQYYSNHLPVCLNSVQLQPGETHFHSFRLTEAVKQWLSFKTIPLNYLCHLTNRRLILEFETAAPLESGLQSFMTSDSQGKAFVQIPREAIQTIRIAKSMVLTPHAQIIFCEAQNELTVDWPKEVIFAVTSTDKAERRNCCKDFVQLSSELFQLSPVRGLPYAVDPAAIAQFQAEIATAKLPVLVDFWAPSCQPCQILAPVIHEIAEQYSGRLNLSKINIEQNSSVPLHYGIDCFPSLLLFKQGSLVDQITGAVPKFMLTQMLDQHLSQTQDQAAA